MSDGADQIELTHCCTEACETLVNSVIQGRLSREVFPEKLRELGLSLKEEIVSNRHCNARNESIEMGVSCYLLIFKPSPDGLLVDEATAYKSRREKFLLDNASH